MVVRKSSVSPASKGEVYSRLQKFKTLQFIAYPYATFEPVKGEEELIWKEGNTSSFYFKLFGIIPFGTHIIKVVRFGLDEGIFTNETNSHVPVWNHEITLEEIDKGRTRYTDIVEIEAGWKTVFVYLWAVCFYTHRQRKWIKMLQKKGKEEC